MITSFFAIIQNNKKGKLEHIVFERKKWRDDIRDIVSKLNEIEFNKNGLTNNKRIIIIKKNIADLEVRLNTVGIADKSDFTKDKEIWEIINEIYSYNTLEEIIQSDVLKKLRRNLSLLLKMDWERSKIETVGNSPKLQLSILTIIQFVICLVFYIAFKELFTFEVNIYLKYYYIVMLGVLLATYLFVLFYNQKKKIWFFFQIFTFCLLFLCQVTTFIFLGLDFNNKVNVDNETNSSYQFYQPNYEFTTYKSNVDKKTYRILDKDDVNGNTKSVFKLIYGEDLNFLFWILIVLFFIIYVIVKIKEIVFISNNYKSLKTYEEVIEKIK
ncbi:hypothetical protein P7H71_00330 [Lactococcus lactis]|uniref:hypothetical protein n=1 Tax=Lactococcus lactis TaxID=1358 RepID=UPI002890801C|nr:hypothetical protein [Lactococcus lactis]MDT2862496.1 hypothetical protein [Lactococcus lactis]MDT2869300.1 hypothetical protein [Lactococcus lactis]MDT2891476.1 hypothetical protein [Lactococcus lactis]MDT2898990.1 hypothetical protein [Lactococcus lactis]MDT2912958.1 hypothetical protein [Lactococcus lactis]